MKRVILLLTFLLFLVLQGKAQAPHTLIADTVVVTFRFLPQSDMFYIPWAGNDKQLNQLCELVDRYRTEIIAGQIPVYVDGYCTSATADAADNFKTAVVRSNRVKSELITRRNLVEENFITRNHATAYEGHADLVVVRLRIPATPPPPTTPAAVREPEPGIVTEAAPRPAEAAPAGQATEEAVRPVAATPPAPAGIPKPRSSFFIRTNLLYDALLTPTLGMEWQAPSGWAVKLDGSYAAWGNEHGRVQKIWLLSPEVRRYLGATKRFYLGAGGNIGRYNIYKGIIGSFFPDDTGYQGKLYGGGVTAGYRLSMGRRFAVDFNLGLGYTRYTYDSFSLIDEVRVYKAKECSKNFWGPTQAGITLVWRVGN